MANSSWGSGWPNCQKSKIVYLSVDGTTFPGGIRWEIHDLVTRLVRETKKRGYVFGRGGDPSYGCWGFNCRAISGTTKPSNHSWGLAVDINAPSNPMKYPPVVTDMPGWMPDLWNAYGFRWGGDYSVGKVDAMHYEFLGSVSQAAEYTRLAQQYHLGEPASPIIPPEPVEEDEMFLMLQRTNDGAVHLISDQGLNAPINDPTSYQGLINAGVKNARVDLDTFNHISDALKKVRTGEA